MIVTKSFADYKTDGAKWITLDTGEYYPDVLPAACELYKPVLVNVTFVQSEGKALKSEKNEYPERKAKAIAKGLSQNVTNGQHRESAQQR